MVGEVSRGSEGDDVLANVGARYELLVVGSQHWRLSNEQNIKLPKVKLIYSWSLRNKGCKAREQPEVFFSWAA